MSAHNVNKLYRYTVKRRRIFKIHNFYGKFVLTDWHSDGFETSPDES
jgi:hypothetical protein